MRCLSLQKPRVDDQPALSQIADPRQCDSAFFQTFEKESPDLDRLAMHPAVKKNATRALDCRRMV